MDKNMIYKVVFEEIKDSTEWGCTCKDDTYSWYIDGVISLTNRIIEELDKKAEAENKTESFDE